MKRDFGLDTLLNMDGFEFHYPNGYWYKIEARQVKADIHLPHASVTPLPYIINTGYGYLAWIINTGQKQNAKAITDGLSNTIIFITVKKIKVYLILLSMLKNY
jgi:hypothetical protein